MAFVRYIDKDKYTEEMQFCEAVKTTTAAIQ